MLPKKDQEKSWKIIIFKLKISFAISSKTDTLSLLEIRNVIIVQ